MKPRILLGLLVLLPHGIFYHPAGWNQTARLDNVFTRMVDAMEHQTQSTKNARDPEPVPRAPRMRLSKTILATAPMTTRVTPPIARPRPMLSVRRIERSSA